MWVSLIIEGLLLFPVKFTLRGTRVTTVIGAHTGVRQKFTMGVSVSRHRIVTLPTVLSHHNVTATPQTGRNGRVRVVTTIFSPSTCHTLIFDGSANNGKEG